MSQLREETVPVLVPYSSTSSTVSMHQHALGGRKRPYYSPDDHGTHNSTLRGSRWAEAGSHNDSIDLHQQHQQHQQQRRRLNRGSAVCSEPSALDAFFQPPQASSYFSPAPVSSSIQFEHMTRHEQRRHPCEIGIYPTNSGSDDSRTLHDFNSSYHAASYGGAPGVAFDPLDELSYTFANEAASDYLPTVGLDFPTEYDMTSYSETPETQGQADQYPRVWQNREEDLPWSPVDASYRQTIVLSQRPRTSAWPGEVPEGLASGLSMQRSNLSSVYPSHISSPLSNASWSQSEMPLLNSTLQLPDPYPTHVEGPFEDEDFTFGQYQNPTSTLAQDGREGENSQFLPLTYNRQNLSPNVSWTPRDLSKSTCFMPDVSTITNWSSPPNDQPLNDMNQVTDNFLLNPLPIPQELDDRLVPTSGARVPTTLKDRKWEHTVVSAGATQQLGGQTTLKVDKKKTGGRTGPLSAESARKAGEVRLAGACWRCWFLHLSCSVDPVCNKCQNLSSFRICNKAHLHDYTKLFFPELIVARRHPSAVRRLIDENVAGFTTNKIQVHLSSGPDYFPITISVHEFVPTNDEFLFVYWAPPELDSPRPNLERIYAPPLALLDNKDNNKLRDSCQEHIKSLIKHNQFSKDATNGDVAPVSWELYEAVNRYRKSKRMSGNADLIRKAMKLHATHFFMSRVIDFTQDSAKKVAEKLRSPVQSPYGHSISSKLLTQQIKQEMNTMQYELTSEILEKLQTELRRRSKASWATSFCLILMLSMCMEAIQLFVDGFIVQKMLDKDAAGASPASRDDGFDIARRLDDQPFRACTDIFHMIYRSGESKTEPSKGRFNPICDGLEVDEAQDIDENTVRLVNDIRRIMADHREWTLVDSTGEAQNANVLLKAEEMEEKARNPTWGCEEDVLADHYRFRRQNSGRLVARFLQSFLEMS